MTRELFDQQINASQMQIVHLGSVVEKGLHQAVDALIHNKAKTARQLIELDHWVNNQRIEIMMGCLTLIATQQPAGPDMRALATHIEIAGELERIHDYVKGIGKISLLRGGEPLTRETGQMIPRMTAITQAMLHDAMAAFAQGNAVAARLIPARDDEVDDLYQYISHHLAVLVTDDVSTYAHSNNLQWAVHNLERSADRVTNICEWVVYMATGEYVEMDN